jgi:hypothetical protein
MLLAIADYRDNGEQRSITIISQLPSVLNTKYEL